MSNELIKAGIKYLAGIAGLVAAGTLIKKGNENLDQHRQNQNSAEKK